MYFGIVMPTQDSLDIHYYLEITVSLLTCVAIYYYYYYLCYPCLRMLSCSLSSTTYFLSVMQWEKIDRAFSFLPYLAGQLAYRRTHEVL